MQTARPSSRNCSSCCRFVSWCCHSLQSSRFPLQCPFCRAAAGALSPLHGVASCALPQLQSSSLLRLPALLHSPNASRPRRCISSTECASSVTGCACWRVMRAQGCAAVGVDVCPAALGFLLSSVQRQLCAAYDPRASCSCKVPPYAAARIL